MARKSRAQKHLEAHRRRDKDYLSIFKLQLVLLCPCLKGEL